jgi:hypothetical protein
MRVLLPCALFAIALPTLAPAADFNRLVHEFSRQTGAHQTWIPFFGLARFAVAVAHPAGTSDLKLAVFEHVNGRQREFIQTADSLVSDTGWKRIVRVRSSKGEATNIYTMPEGDKLRMLVTTVDDGDAVFVEVRIKPDELIKFVDEHHGKHPMD